MATDHDSGYKALFSAPEFVRDLILGFVPDEWLHGLDYGTLEKVPGHYVSEDLRQRESDIVWRVKVGGDWVYLYLLIEFQSSVDKYMALRMMVYVGLLYQDLVKRGEVLADGRLPPILPVVLYNGEKRWTAATEVAELIPRVPGLVEQFKPKFRHLLIDEGAYGESELASAKNLVAALFRFEYPVSPESVRELVARVHDWLIDRPDLRRLIARWLRATLMRREEYRIVLPQVEDLQELNVMLAERLEDWATAYRAEGMQQGMQKGEALALQKLLAKRFGAVPMTIASQISGASAEQIEAWLDRVLDAPSLEAVFGSPDTRH